MHAGGSVLGEQRSSGPAWADFPTRYAAAAIAKDQAAVKVVSQFQISGHPLLYFTEDRKAVVVDKRYFSDLAAIDVPGLPKGERKVVGTATAEARAAMKGREILEFLVKTDVLRIYWHVEGEACLLTEDSSAGAYKAEIEGSHIYFTNHRNQKQFALTFEIAADGTMAVTGR
jgi:hypothetical protein